MHSGQGEKPWGWHAPVLSWHRLNRGWGLMGVSEGPGRVLPACAGGPAQGKACQLWPRCLTQDGSAPSMWLECGRQSSVHLLADCGPLHFMPFAAGVPTSQIPGNLGSPPPPPSLLPTCRQLVAMVSGRVCTDFPGLGLGGCGQEDAGPAGVMGEWSLSVL